MLDLSLTCTACGLRAAQLRINASSICRECALVMINRAAPPAPPPAPYLRPRERVLARLAGGPVARGAVLKGGLPACQALDRLIADGDVVEYDGHMLDAQQRMRRVRMIARRGDAAIVPLAPVGMAA